ncbi:MAG TPA: hypothetical protein VIY47_02935 [Ignavibacteriaceae bacterium]
MSIEAVQKAYSIFSDQETTLFYTDEEVYNLISEIAKYILQHQTPSQDNTNGIPEGYITIKEFSSLYPLFCKGTLYEIARSPEMRNYTTSMSNPGIGGRTRYFDKEALLKGIQNRNAKFDTLMKYMDYSKK